jgi:prepilin-type N-terminal cleavage/methylation domain-containing protein
LFVGHLAECRGTADLRKVILIERSERGAPMGRTEKTGVGPCKPGVAGFGLVESMVVLAILAAGAACAAPALASWRARDRVEAVSHGWLALLQQGRDQAIRTGSQVTLCQGRLHNGEGRQDSECALARLPCDGGRTGMGDWSCVQMVSVDSEGRLVAAATQFSFDANVMVSGDPRPLRFLPPTGRIAGGPRHFEIGQHKREKPTAGGDVAKESPYVAEQPVEHRCVLLAASGRVRMQRGRCGRA